MHKCSWSPGCRRVPPVGEFCEQHAVIMIPFFSVRSQLRRNWRRAPAATVTASRRQLDRDRAVVLAQLVADHQPLKLDGTSEALQRAISVAVEHGYIASTRSGFVPSSPTPMPRAAAAKRATPEDDVKAVVQALESSDVPMLRRELIRQLSISSERMTAAAKAGRERGLFHTRRGKVGGGYRLGVHPDDALPEERQDAA